MVWWVIESTLILQRAFFSLNFTKRGIRSHWVGFEHILSVWDWVRGCKISVSYCDDSKISAESFVLLSKSVSEETENCGDTQRFISSFSLIPFKSLHTLTPSFQHQSALVAFYHIHLQITFQLSTTPSCGGDFLAVYSSPTQSPSHLYSISNQWFSPP